VEGSDGKHCFDLLLILSAEFVLHLVSSAITSVDLKPAYLPESSPMTSTCRIQLYETIAKELVRKVLVNTEFFSRMSKSRWMPLRIQLLALLVQNEH
jgi:hypothetical protein